MLKILMKLLTFAKEIKNFIITRGEKGAISINGISNVKLESKKILKLVDLTGAGDLFAAGYLHGYLNNFSQKDCLRKRY